MGIFTRYKDGRIDVVPHAVLQIFAKFQSQVGKILILAINIPPRLAGRRMLAAAGAAAFRLGLRRGPDSLTCHVTRVASAAGTHSVFLQAGRGKSRKHVTWARYS